MSENIILNAEFNPKVCPYWLISGIGILVVTVVGIPLLPIWVIAGLYLTRRYLSRMECILTEKDLKVNKGIWVRVEKTIPLDKITDLGLVRGPLMRYFGISRLSIETAGQSVPGALVALTGIEDVEGFRDAVLNQRDRLREASGGSKVEIGESAETRDSDTLTEIKESLFRIEEILKGGN